MKTHSAFFSAIIVCMAVCAFTKAASAQPGTLDADFNSADLGHGNGDGPQGQVIRSAVLPDGRVLIAGPIGRYNGTERPYLACLHADGSLDNTFGTGSGPDFDVYAIAVQPDGKVLLAGNFSTYDGTPVMRVARLLPNGTLDPSFDPGTGPNGYVLTCTILPDGKLILGGSFTEYNGFPCHQLCRVNTDGSFDPGFDAGTGPNYNVLTAALTDEGKLVIGGDFTSWNGTPQGGLVRLDSNGSVDPGFDIGTGSDALVFTAMVQPDGKILIGGDFTNFNGIPCGRIARLDANGALDMGFDAGGGAEQAVYRLTLQTDWTILVSGSFFSINGFSCNYMARLLPDGAFDQAFAPAIFGYSNIPLAELPDGKVLAGAQRLNGDGTIDYSFNAGTGANSQVLASAIQPDGKVLLGGYFTRCNGMPITGIARVDSAGVLDTSFISGLEGFSIPQAIAMQADGKVLIGGGFTTYAGIPCMNLCRVHPDGSLDTTFQTGTGAEFNVQAIAVQPDGKIVIGGQFTTFNGVPRNHLARLNPDGTLDTGFDPGAGPGGFVNAVALQPDGKILVAGSFFSFGGVPANSLARANPDGSWDNTFNAATASMANNHAVCLQPDGKVLVGGFLAVHNGNQYVGLGRLNADGSLDSSFCAATNIYNEVFGIALQPDGKIIAGGNFSAVNNVPRQGIARINAEGGLDVTFNPGTGIAESNGMFPNVNTMALQPDGRCIIGGDFTAYNGTGRNRFARIIGGSGTQSVPGVPVSANTLAVWPNPCSNGQLHVSLGGMEAAVRSTAFEILDACGRTLMLQHPSALQGERDTTLDVGALPSGAYLLHLHAGNRLLSQRFMVVP